LHRLSSIDVTGNNIISRAELAPLLALQPGEPFVDSRMATVASAVTELYRVRGFAQATVKPEISVLPVQKADGQEYRPVAARLSITEGPATIVGDVTIDGARQIDEPRVRASLTLLAGRPFYRPQLDADRNALERLYQNDGYRDVRIEARTEVLDEARRLNVHWHIDEGARTLVDHVLVSGNARTSAALIRREVALQPGKPLGDEALIESQRRLAALGLFRRVRIVELPHGSNLSRDVLIEVEEAPATTVAYGGGLEAGRRFRLGDEGRQAEERIEVAPRGFLELTRRNLWGKNRSVTLLTRVSFRPRDPATDSTDVADEGGYGFNEYRVVSTFREPRPFDTTGDLQLTAFVEQAIRTSFNFRRRGIRTEYARRLRDALTVSGRYAFDHTRLFDEKIKAGDQLLIDRLFPQVRLSTVTGSVLRDTRNDVLDPARGTVLGIDGSIAARRMGSEVGFLRSFTQAFAYRRLPGAAQLTLAAGVRLGFAVGFERRVERRDSAGMPVIGPDGQPIVDIVDDVPASERFFAGGDTTVRGFVLDRLGTEDTRNAEGFPTGGNGLAVVNLELRTPYWKGLGGVGFLDAGNVFKSAVDIALDDLRPAAGFGIRYRSPLGPVRVDLGFNLNPQVLSGGARERRTVFHISLGQAF
jgi:outer membrane protein assembly factor BamA